MSSNYAVFFSGDDVVLEEESEEDDSIKGIYFIIKVRGFCN